MNKIKPVIKSLFRVTYFYPIAFSLFPILALYNFNIGYVHYTSILRSVGITTTCAIILLILANVTLRNHAKSAIVVTFILFLFFVYGHLFSYFDTLLPGIIQNRYLTGIWIFLTISGVWWVIKNSKKTEEANKFLGAASFTLLLIGLLNATTFEIRRFKSNIDNRNQVTSKIDDDFSITVDALPDIYYIILDAHARSDVLLNKFRYDNSDFLSELEELGFFVADCSQTNYWITEYSLTSSLNLDYLQNFLENPDVLPDWKFSTVRTTLDKLGYTIVSFESRGTHNVDLGVDIMLSRRSKPDIYEDIYPFTNLNEYEVMLIKTTWLQSWLQLLANFQNQLPDNVTLDADNAAYLEHYRQTLFILDELPRVPYLESPKFVMVHLLIPHEPFIFNPDGKYEYHKTDEEFVIGYRNNAQFIDTQIGKVVGKIIERSQVPPIIIIQGDHGPNGSPPDVLLPILNAYYLPNMAFDPLYEKITPVNTFRVIFNAYFGTEYKLLDDVSYYGQSTAFEDYEMIPVSCP